MVVDKTKTGLTFPHKRYTRPWQEQHLRVAGASRIIHVGKDCESWRDVTTPTVMREGDTFYVVGMALVPTERGGDKLSPISQLSVFFCKSKELGATVVETWSGRKSTNWRHKEAMIADAEKSLRSAGRRLPPGQKEPGRPERPFAKEQIEQAKAAWFSKDYATNGAAEKHFPEGFTRHRANRMFGPSGRKPGGP